MSGGGQRARGVPYLRPLVAHIEAGIDHILDVHDDIGEGLRAHRSLGDIIAAHEESNDFRSIAGDVRREDKETIATCLPHSHSIHPREPPYVPIVSIRVRFRIRGAILGDLVALIPAQSLPVDLLPLGAKCPHNSR